MILITGGSGFIGSLLSRQLLAAGKTVRVFDKAPSQVGSAWVGDVRDFNALLAACRGIETIYHLAAEHADDVTPESLYSDVNVEGTKNLVQAARHHQVRTIIFTSTVAVYGLNNPEARENSAPDPFNEYGRSKLEAEHVLLAWAQEDSARALVIVRPCVVFGEGNRGNVHNLLRQIHRGRFLMIGKGENKKSMAYVGNLVQFLCRLKDSPPGTTILNYADKPDLSIGELVRIARKKMNKHQEATRIPCWLGLTIGYLFDGASVVTRRRFSISSARIRKFCADTSVSTERLARMDFAAPYTLQDGLERMIRADFDMDRS